MYEYEMGVIRYNSNRIRVQIIIVVGQINENNNTLIFDPAGK